MLKLSAQTTNIGLVISKQSSRKGRMAEDVKKPVEKYFYFVDGVKYESDVEVLTGAQIKARIPNFDHALLLMLEGAGKEPDSIVTDDTSISLAKDKGPRRFFTTPPATFGRR